LLHIPKVLSLPLSRLLAQPPSGATRVFRLSESAVVLLDFLFGRSWTGDATFLRVCEGERVRKGRNGEVGQTKRSCRP
jgi:hypothetical protein